MIPIPESTLIVTLTAAGFSILTNLLTRRFVNVKRERTMKATASQYQAELKAAKRSRDAEKLKRLKKKEKAMRKMSTGMTGTRLKIMVVTFVPFFFLYYVVASLLGGYYVVVAYSPFPISIPLMTAPAANGMGVTFFGWYTICSLAFSGIFMRIFHTSPT